MAVSSMNNQQALTELHSSDWNRVTSALSRLSAEREDVPSPEVFQKMIDLMSDSDMEIRRLAIFAAGLHWQHIPAVPRIITALKDPRENPCVQACAATALGTIARNNDTVRDRVIRELAQVALDTTRPDEARDAAYNSALWASCRINPSDPKEKSVSRDQTDADWIWLNQFSLD